MCSHIRQIKYKTEKKTPIYFLTGYRYQLLLLVSIICNKKTEIPKYVFSALGLQHFYMTKIKNKCTSCIIKSKHSTKCHFIHAVTSLHQGFICIIPPEPQQDIKCKLQSDKKSTFPVIMEFFSVAIAHVHLCLSTFATLWLTKKSISEHSQIFLNELKYHMNSNPPKHFSSHMTRFGYQSQRTKSLFWRKGYLSWLNLFLSNSTSTS